MVVEPGGARRDVRDLGRGGTGEARRPDCRRLSELADLPASALDDELAKARNQIAASQFKALTSASGRASDLASNWHEARDLDFTRRYLAALKATTAADVRRAMAKLTEDQVTISILDPVDAPPPAALKTAARHRPE